MKKICIVGTLDTKGLEYSYLKTIIESNGFETVVVDAGIKGTAYFAPDISSVDIAAQMGTTREKLVSLNDPSAALKIMAEGVRKTVNALFEQEKIAGCVSLGGGQGSFIGCTAMADLPIGFPKVLASTIAFANHDLTMRDIKDGYVADTIVDVCGLNSILMRVLENAAGAICGMARTYRPIQSSGKKRVAISMFGVTNPCVERIMKQLGDKYEIQVYHATGTGGAYLEKMIRQGQVDAVIDLTTAEISQTVTRGSCACAEPRLMAAAERGIPQVISVGGVDLINCVPGQAEKGAAQGRRLHQHNPTMTIMRTNEEEMLETARIMAERINLAKGPVKVVLPLKGVSAYDKEDMFFFAPEVDEVLFSELKSRINKDIEIIEMDNHINDEAFADKMVELMLNMIEG